MSEAITKHSELIGPFKIYEYYSVRARGCKVPHIHCRKLGGEQDGYIEVILDNRMSYLIGEDEAEVVLALVADAMAVAAGYPCMGATEKMNPFNVKLIGQ